MKRAWSSIISFTSALRGFTWLVALPTLVVAAYYAFFASPIYVSETQFTVRSQSNNALGASALGGILGSVSSSVSTQDVAIVGDYLLSRDMLEKLNEVLDLRTHFSDPKIDWWARLPADCSAECFLDYYQDKVSILVDKISGIVTLETMAFDPATAKAMADLMLAQSETLVNKLSEQITRDSVSFAESEMRAAERRFKDAGEQLTQYRNTTNVLDPAEKTGAVMGIINALESSLAEARAERDQLLSYLRADSSEIVTVNARIKALQDQIANENKRLTGEEQVELSAILQEYERHVLEKEIAHQLYTSTLASLESARNEASRKQLYLVTFVRPSLAESAVEPKGGWNTLTVFALLLLCYVLGGLMVTTIKDHVGF